jgi:HK97 family phage prohead protease
MRFLDSCHFKTLCAKRTKAGLIRTAPLAGVRKDMVDVVQRIDDRILRFTISTASVDRDLDSVAVAGWQLDNFARNPVVLWAHRADEPPIGKAIDFGRDDNRLFSAVQFLPPEGYGAASDVAEMIYKMVRDGYLSATSVGFRPIKWDFNPDRDDGGFFPGIDFEEQELVELSIVPVPSNPDALIDIAPGGDDGRNVAPVLIPAPVQVVHFEAADRRSSLSRGQAQRRARAAMLGVW